MKDLKYIRGVHQKELQYWVTATQKVTLESLVVDAEVRGEGLAQATVSQKTRKLEEALLCNNRAYRSLKEEAEKEILRLKELLSLIG